MRRDVRILVGGTPPASSFILGETEPVASNSGFAGAGVAEYQLSNYAGSLTNLKAGDPPASRLAITGNVEPYNSGGTLRESLILMGASPYATGIEYPAVRGLHSGVSGTTLEFVTVRPSVKSVDTYGPQGGGFTTRRCDISGVVDGFHVNGLTGEFMFFRTEGDYVHDLVSYDVDPRQSGGHSHNDGLQAAGNLDMEVVGTAFHGGYTSAMLIQQGLGTYTKAFIDRAWLYGDPNAGSSAGAAFIVSENGKGPINNLTLTNCRFGGKTYSQIPATTYNASTTLIAGNIDLNTGQPLVFDIR